MSGIVFHQRFINILDFAIPVSRCADVLGKILVSRISALFEAKFSNILLKNVQCASSPSGKRWA